MTIDSMENVAVNEQEIMARLSNNEDEHENRDKPKEHEESEFEKLHSMLPFLTSKSVTQLDIVLEAITYINMLQNKLVENIQ